LFQMLLGEEITVNNDSSGLLPGDSLVHTKVLDHVVELSLWMLQNVDFVGNGSSGWWLISSNHDDFDTSRAAFLYRKVDLWSWWIIEGDNADEGQIMHWETSLNTLVVRSRLLGVKTPLFPGLDIELVVAGIFALWKCAFGESKYSLSELSEVRVGLGHLLSQFLSEWNLFAVDEELAASGEDSLRSTLQVHAETSTVFLHISDESIELDVRTEWNEAFNLFVVLGVNVGWIFCSGAVEGHDGLSELDKSGL